MDKLQAVTTLPAGCKHDGRNIHTHACLMAQEPQKAAPSAPAAAAHSSLQLLGPIILGKVLAELACLLLLHSGRVGALPAVHVLCRQAQQAYQHLQARQKAMEDGV